MNIFIDTQDMEERYGEQLYQDYLVEQNKDLQERIDKAKEYIENRTYSSVATMKTVLNLQNDELYDLLEILGGDVDDK